MNHQRSLFRLWDTYKKFKIIAQNVILLDDSYQSAGDGNYGSDRASTRDSIHRLGRIIVFPQAVHMSVVSNSQRFAGKVFSNLHQRSLGLDTAAKGNNWYHTSRIRTLLNRKTVRGWSAPATARAQPLASFFCSTGYILIVIHQGGPRGCYSWKGILPQAVLEITFYFQHSISQKA